MTATLVMQEKPSAKSPSNSNGPCINAINPKAIHKMMTTDLTRGTAMTTTLYLRMFQEIPPICSGEGMNLGIPGYGQENRTF